MQIPNLSILHPQIIMFYECFSQCDLNSKRATSTRTQYLLDKPCHQPDSAESLPPPSPLLHLVCDLDQALQGAILKSSRNSHELQIMPLRTLARGV